MKTFICENDLTEQQIQAESSVGVLTPWRVDTEGRQWYIRELPPLIRGVSVGVDEIRGADGR